MSTPRYLEAKRTVDDRSFNRRVHDRFLETVSDAPMIIEVGAGTGVTIPRLLAWGIDAGSYRGLDTDARSVAFAKTVRPATLRYDDETIEQTATGFRVRELEVSFGCADAFEALSSDTGADLLIAQQVFDLVGVDRALDAWLPALRPGGLAYLPLTFDGMTAFQPSHPADDAIIEAYHASMDARPNGDSHAGRHLLEALTQRAGDVLAVGGSDAIIRPHDGEYPADEQAVLDQLLDFIADSVDPQAVPAVEDWLATRRAQLAAGELGYIAHRLDCLYRAPA